MKGLRLRKARLQDTHQIHRLISIYASKGELLGRSQLEIFETVRDFTVADLEGEIVGVCALHFWWMDMGEVRSLVVKRRYRGKGIGRALVEKVIEEAKELGASKVFALTRKEDFFKKLGFKRVDKSILPQKVWGECVRCPKFLNCDEEAYIKELFDT